LHSSARSFNELKSIEDGDEEKGFLGLFKKGGNKIANMKAKYAKAEGSRQDPLSGRCPELILKNLRSSSGSLRHTAAPFGNSDLDLLAKRINLLLFLGS